jgi:hypothetical protein
VKNWQFKNKKRNVVPKELNRYLIEVSQNNSGKQRKSEREEDENETLLTDDNKIHRLRNTLGEM